jgi:hypothetical protein
MIKLKKSDIVNNVENPSTGYVILGVDEYGRLVIKDEYGNTDNVVQDLSTGTFNEVIADFLTIGDRDTDEPYGAKGVNSFSQGVSNKAYGDNSTAIGSLAYAIEHLTYAHGLYVKADNQYAYVYGAGVSLEKQLVSSGLNSFVHSYMRGTIECGAYADYSAILGGSDNNIELGAINSAIIGGRNNTINAAATNSVIIAVSGVTATTKDTLYTGYVNGFGYAIRGVSNGDTKFLKADGSVDSNLYLTLAGGTISGAVTGTSFAVVGPLGFLKSDGTVDTNSYLNLLGGTLSGVLTGTGFAVTGGTNTKFLKGDGSLDTQRYINSSGDTMTGVLTGTGFAVVGPLGFLKSNGLVDSQRYINSSGDTMTGALTGTTAYFNQFTIEDNVVDLYSVSLFHTGTLQGNNSISTFKIEESDSVFNLINYQLEKILQFSYDGSLSNARMDFVGRGDTSIHFYTSINNINDPYSSTNDPSIVISKNGFVGINMFHGSLEQDGSIEAKSPLHIVQHGEEKNSGIQIDSDVNRTNSISNEKWYIHSTNGGLASRLNFTNEDSNSNINNYWIDSSGPDTGLNFTGQHRTVPTNKVDFNNVDNMIGLIVVSDGTYDNLIDNDNPTIDESLPNISLANKTKDKKVFGVISKKEEITNGFREYTVGAFVTSQKLGIDEQPRIVINSIGEGAIMVCNFNGNLENGDYITSCEIPGFGVKQDDDLLHNYTVAKITQDCDFSDETKYVEFSYNNITYKKQLVGCTYHCG